MWRTCTLFERGCVFHILVVQEFTPQFSQDSLNGLIDFKRKLCSKFPSDHVAIDLQFVFGGAERMFGPPIGCINYVPKYSDLAAYWNRKGNYLSQGSKKMESITRYADMFDIIRNYFKDKDFKAWNVLVLITEGREQCKVEKCLNNNCCRPCHVCNSSHCDRRFLASDNTTQVVKLFVTHEAEDLKNDGGTIVTIGVGNETEPARLRCFASPNGYIQIDSYKRLSVDAYAGLARLLSAPAAPLPSTNAAPITRLHSTANNASKTLPYTTGNNKSSFPYFAPITQRPAATDHTSKSKPVSRNNSVAGFTTLRMNSMAANVPWWHPVATVGGVALVVLILVVVIVILLKRFRVIGTTDRRDNGATQRERSKRVTRVQKSSEYGTAWKPLDLFRGSRPDGEGAYMKLRSVEISRAVKSAPYGRLSVAKKSAVVPKHPKAKQSTKTSSTRTKESSSSALTQPTTEESTRYDTVNPKNAKSKCGSAATKRFRAISDYEQLR